MSVSGFDAALQCPSGTGTSGGSSAAFELPPGSSSALPARTVPAHRARRSSAERRLGGAGTATDPSLGGLAVFNDETVHRLGGSPEEPDGGTRVGRNATESVPLLRFGYRFRR